MKPRIEWRAPRHWEVVADDGRDAAIGTIREDGEEAEAFSIQAGGTDPSLLADLTGRRYGSLDRVAGAIGEHLEGDCRIR